MIFPLLSISRRTKRRDTALQPFLGMKLPIFWIIGPSASSKSTIAEMLAKSSQFHLISLQSLKKDEMQKRKWNVNNSTRSNENQDLFIHLLKEEFIRTYQNSTGYIIDGFPMNIREANLFEKHICKVNVIIYLTLTLDALLCRRVTQLHYFDVEEERIKYVDSLRNINKIVQKFQRKTIKIASKYPPEDTCTKLVVTLEDDWGYKFMRLYNKSS
ncbi:uncharacterized protein LOC116167382 [Photinus pyralis]|nr:uncharacterized protein LOC116167382 [Photinus pyralis]